MPDRAGPAAGDGRPSEKAANSDTSSFRKMPERPPVEDDVMHRHQQDMLGGRQSVERQPEDRTGEQVERPATFLFTG